MSDGGANRAAPVAFVLAGGLGTRLRTVVSDRPKVLADVGGRPWLSYLLDQLIEAGIERVVLGTGYLGEQVEQSFGSEYGSLTLAYSREPEPLGTAGALRFATEALGEAEEILVLNGDSFCDVDLSRFLTWHRERGARASAVLTTVNDGSRFGGVHTREDGLVISFLEKSGSPQSSDGLQWINAGVYCMNRRVVDAIPRDRAVSLEHDVFPSMIGEAFYGYRAGGRFIDIGIPSSLAEAQNFFPLATPRAVLLDRDGTIIVDRHYLANPALVELLPGAAEGLRRMQRQGWKLAIVSNQSAVGRGYIDEATLRLIHERMEELLAVEGIHLDGIFYCPHVPSDGCHCRKPATGLAEEASRSLGFSLSRAVIVGDKACDIELGRELGLPTILVMTGYGAREHAGGLTAEVLAVDLTAAADAVEALVAGGFSHLERSDDAGVP